MITKDNIRQLLESNQLEFRYSDQWIGTTWIPIRTSPHPQTSPDWELPFNFSLNTVYNSSAITDDHFDGGGNFKENWLRVKT